MTTTEPDSPEAPSTDEQPTPQPVDPPDPPDPTADKPSPGQPDKTDTPRDGTKPDQSTPGSPRQVTPNERLTLDNVDVLNLFITDNRSGGIYVSGGTATAETFAGRDSSAVAGSGGTSRILDMVTVTATSADEVRRVRAVMIHTETHDRAADILLRHRFVVLRGRNGVGKKAAAITLLAQHATVLNVDPSVTVRQLVDFAKLIQQPEAHAYLVDSLAPNTARDINEFTARRLTDQLATAEAYLVLTVDDQVALQPEVRALAVEVAPPELATAMDRHLRYYLSSATPDADLDAAVTELRHRLDQLQVHALLVEQGVRMVDQVAERTVSARRSGTSVEDALTELGLNARQRVRGWFAQERDAAHELSDVALLLSATVLSGSTFATVNKHAARIEQILAELSRQDLEAMALRPLRLRQERLSRALSVLRRGVIRTHFGDVVGELVALESDFLIKAVLDVVWHEHDLVADALMLWLFEAGCSDDRDVQTRVAFVAGQLASHDLAGVTDRLLRPWADDPDGDARWTAAYALAVPAAKDELASSVLRLLSSWAEGSPTLISTAIMAYCSYVGMRRPHRAMRQLLEVCTAQAWSRTTVQNWAQQLLLLAGSQDPERGRIVLAGLAEWLSDRRDAAAPTACVIFGRALATSAKPSSWQSRQMWELLAAPGARTYSSKLLVACMDRQETRTTAFDALFKLLLLADSDEDDSIYQQIEDLVLAALSRVGPTSVGARRMAAYVSRWSSAPGSLRSHRRLAAAIGGVTTR